MYYACMPRCFEPGLRLQSLRQILNATLLILVLVVTKPGRLSGQVDTTNNSVTTLRVFENLIQIPVVVLGPTFELTRPIPSNRFYVSLDSGPPFRATHVRLEGDDPIALSILIDLSTDEDFAMSLGQAIARLTRASLQNQDRVSIYALRHCEMWQAGQSEAPQPGALGKRVGSLKQDWPGGWKKRLEANCQHKVLLLGALAQVIHGSSKLPGRRVVLALSDGTDVGSKRGWAEVGSLAAASGAAVFGLKSAEFQADAFSDVNRGLESPFRTLCESSGGLVFTSTSFSLRERLNDFMELLRKRYIVEFPRPEDIESGKHSIQVTISRSNAFIRSAGISVPIADPAVLADPNTLRTDPGHAPTVGKRKPMATPQ